MKVLYIKNNRHTYALIQQQNILEEYNGKNRCCFTATYKGFSIQITTDHGHGQPQNNDLKRFDIAVQNIKNGILDVDTWEDLPTLHQAVKYALIGACLIEPDNKTDYTE